MNNCEDKKDNGLTLQDIINTMPNKLLSAPVTTPDSIKKLNYLVESSLNDRYLYIYY